MSSEKSWFTQGSKNMGFRHLLIWKESLNPLDWFKKSSRSAFASGWHPIISLTLWCQGSPYTMWRVVLANGFKALHLQQSTHCSSLRHSERADCNAWHRLQHRSSLWLIHTLSPFLLGGKEAMSVTGTAVCLHFPNALLQCGNLCFVVDTKADLFTVLHLQPHSRAMSDKSYPFLLYNA